MNSREKSRANKGLNSHALNDQVGSQANDVPIRGTVMYKDGLLLTDGMRRPVFGRDAVYAPKLSRC